MSTMVAPLAVYDSLFPEVVRDSSLRLKDFKDLSSGGACETGYGEQTRIHQALQYLTNLKHSEKHTPFIRWGITSVPALLDALPGIIQSDGRRTPLADIPSRTYTVLKELISNISAKQAGFVLSIIPLYHNTRTIKNHIWPGHGFDPSGHTMFKIAQYGMMYSITTDHGKKSSVTIPTALYITFTAIADTLMLNNTIAHCHTLGEILAGGVMGMGILLAAHLISEHTPLGEYVKQGTQAVAEMAREVGNRVFSMLAAI